MAKFDLCNIFLFSFLKFNCATEQSAYYKIYIFAACRHCNSPSLHKEGVVDPRL